MNEVPKAERPKRQRFSCREFVAGLTNAFSQRRSNGPKCSMQHVTL